MTQSLFIICCVSACLYGLLITIIRYHIDYTQALIESQKHSPFFSSYSLPTIPEKKKNTNNHRQKKNKHEQLLTLLAVDDNPANILILHDYLQHQKVIFMSANDGNEALKILQKNSVDLILMDIEMQGLDGISTTKIIRSIEKENYNNDIQKRITRIPIIGVSAHKKHEKMLDILSSGFDDYISKPIQQETLFNCLHRWCDVDFTIQDLSEKIPTSSNHHIQNQQTAKPLLSTKKFNKAVNVELSLQHSNYNAELAQDMLALLIQMIKDEKERLLLHYQKNDWEALYQLNHKIYGGCSYCGTPALLHASQQLESQLQTLIHSSESRTKSEEITAKTNINERLDTLIEAIDELIIWDDEHDITIVFGVDD